MKLQTIVVATDFSDGAQIAVDQAATLARHTDATLVLLHGVERLPYADLESSLWQELQRESAIAARKQLSAIAKRLREAGLEVQLELVEDSTTPALVEAANALRPDLVVIGSRGNTGIKRFLLGSVAEKFVRRSAGSVLVARKPRDGTRLLDHILVGTDFSEAAEHALTVAVELAAANASIELYHAYHLPPGALGFWADYAEDHGKSLETLDAAIAREAAARGAELAERHARAGVSIRFRAERAPEREGIVARLETEPFDLAVVASHNRRGLARWLVGSIAEGTVRHAPCSVLVVRGEERE